MPIKGDWGIAEMARVFLPDERTDGRRFDWATMGGELPRAAPLSAMALAAVFLTFAAASWWGIRVDPEFSHDADTMLTATAAALLLPAAFFFLLRARHESRQASVGMAVGATMLAIVTLGTAELTPLITETPYERVAALRGWSLVGALAAFALGLSNLPGERTSRRLMALPAAVLLMAVGGALLPAQELTPPDILVVVGWLAVALAHGYAFVSTGQPHRAWIALGMLGLMLGDVARAAAADPELWAMAAGVVRNMGVLMMLCGLVGNLEIRQWQQRQQLDTSEELMAELQAITDAVQRSLEERDHEARSALAAIEYTAHAMRRRGAHVRQGDLEQLELAMVTEVELLRRLVTMPDRARELEIFDVNLAVAGIVKAESLVGLDVEWSGPAGLAAVGSASATSEIVQALLENARRHAFGSPVTVAASRRGPYVIIQVDDRGPGVPAERQTSIFKRGRDGGHPTSAGGRGLGLYIAARLAREQRGHLWVQDAPGGGASFRLALAAADAAGGARMTVGRQVGGRVGGGAGAPAGEEG